MENIKILIVEDHAAMIEGYRSMLAKEEQNKTFTITTTANCEGGYFAIVNPESKFDIIFLDVILPPFEKCGIFSGEDLAILAKQYLPDSKIIMFTSHADSFTLYNIIKKINPNGLLVKSDFAQEEFHEALDLIMEDGIHYSATAKQSLRNIQDKNVYLDAYNRKIISLLASGVKTKNLPQHIHLSISAIDKRKAFIKDFFNIEKGTDEDILREAKLKGFI